MKAICFNPLCGIEFEKYDRSRNGGHHGEIKRPHRSITCSPKCSKEYSRYKERMKQKNRRIDKLTEALSYALMLRWLHEIKLCYDNQFKKSPTNREINILSKIAKENQQQHINEIQEFIDNYRRSKNYEKDMKEFSIQLEEF